MNSSGRQSAIGERQHRKHCCHPAWKGEIRVIPGYKPYPDKAGIGFFYIRHNIYIKKGYSYGRPSKTL